MSFYRLILTILLITGLVSPSSAQAARDSLQFKVDGLFQGKGPSFDSIQNRLSNRIDNIASLPRKFTHIGDSIKPNLTQCNRKLEVVKRKLTHRIDSLNKIGQPTDHYASLLDSIQNAGPLKDVKQAEARLNSLEAQVKKPLDNVNSSIKDVRKKINDKINLINKEGNGSMILGVDVPGLPNPQGQTGLPNLQTNGVNSNLPGANIDLPSNALPGIDNPLNGVSPGSINLPTNQLNDITNAPQLQINQITNNQKLSKIENQMGKIDGYSRDLKNISTGDVDKVKEVRGELENKVMGEANMGAFGDMSSAVTSAKDEKAMKKLLKEKAKEQVINHFAGQDKQLHGAMTQVSKLKQRYSSVTSLKDIPKGIPNSMKGKPLIERIVPGLTWQLQMKGIALLDLNPNVGYRFSGKLTFGGGWNERIGIEDWNITHSQRIYGPRTFVDFKFSRDFSVRTEVEVMNTHIPSLGYNGGSSEGSRQWVWGWFLGIKKDYKFSKHVRGNVQTLYNFLDKVYNTNPYADRLNIRMGFQLSEL